MSCRGGSFFFYYRFFLFILLLSGSVAQAHEAKRGCCVIEAAQKEGLFSHLFALLGYFIAFEAGEYSGLRIHFSSPMYFEPSFGSNWWEYYFEPLVVGEQAPLLRRSVLSRRRLAQNIADHEQTYRDYLGGLLARYVQVKPFIHNMVNELVDTHLREECVIGVHYRGTDKLAVIGGRAVDPYRVLAQIDNLMLEKKALGIACKLFVATDTQSFLDLCLAQYPTLVSLDFPRSTNQVALHAFEYKCVTPFEKGLFALLDCLLLSRCDILIRTNDSCLSLCSMLFNPKLLVYEMQGKIVSKSL